MATQIDAQRIRLEKKAIWSVIVRDVYRFEGEAGLSPQNSKRWTRIDETMQELAGMLVEEVSDSESESLTHATEAIWDTIRDHLVEWAVEIEQARETRRVIAA